MSTVSLFICVHLSKSSWTATSGRVLSFAYLFWDLPISINVCQIVQTDCFMFLNWIGAVHLDYHVWSRCWSALFLSLLLLFIAISNWLPSQCLCFTVTLSNRFIIELHAVQYTALFHQRWRIIRSLMNDAAMLYLIQLIVLSNTLLGSYPLKCC